MWMVSFYDQKETILGKALAEFNEQQSTIKFTMGKETHNSINFLDLLMQRKEKEFEYTIHKSHSNRTHNTQRLLPSIQK
jgi:hypothetical protein